MKRLQLHHVIAWLLLIIMGFIVIHAPITVFVSSHWPNIAEVVKAWKELLMIVAFALLIIVCSQKRAWKWMARDHLLWMMAGFVALHFAVALVFHLSTKAIVAGLMIDLRYIAYFALVYVFLRLYPHYRPSFLKVAMYGAAIVVGFAVLQLILPHNFLSHLGYGDKTIEPYITIDKNPAFVRENSTLRGPNPLGAYALMVLTAIVAYSAYMRDKLRENRVRNILLFFAIAGIIALAVSYSRSAWIGAVIAVLIAYITKYHNVFNPRRLGLIAAATLVIVAIAYSARHSYFVQNVVVHNNPTTGASIDSNTGHLDSLKAGLEDSLSHPLGRGVGSTGSASLFTNQPAIVENQFLFVAHEVGWPGIVLYIAILVTVLIRLWRRRNDWMALAAFASGIGLIVIGMMLPVWADDTVSIVWWGLAAVVLAPGKEETHGRATNQKAKRTA